MKTTARRPLAQLSADESHVDAFKALAHLSRLQVFFVLVKAGKALSVGEIQEAVEIPGPTLSSPFRRAARSAPARSITWASRWTRSRR
jgi:DNA-binding transcriptional ArsR family regulator